MCSPQVFQTHFSLTHESQRQNVSWLFYYLNTVYGFKKIFVIEHYVCVRSDCFSMKPAPDLSLTVTQCCETFITLGRREPLQGVCSHLYESFCVCSACWSQIPGEAFVSFMSLGLLVWVGGGSASPGTLQQLRCSDRGVAGVTEESRPSGVGFSSLPVFVPPSAVNGRGPDLHQHTHHNETKSGVSCVSVWACAKGRGGKTTHKHTPLVLPFCQEIRSQTMRVTRPSFRFVRQGGWSEGGNSQWSDCDSSDFYKLLYSNLREQIWECLLMRERVSCSKLGQQRQHNTAQGETWLQSHSVLSARAAKTSCLVYCHVTSVSCSLGGARSSTLSSSPVALSCTYLHPLTPVSALFSLPVTCVWAVSMNEECVCVSMFTERDVVNVCFWGGWTCRPSAGTAGGVWVG